MSMSYSNPRTSAVIPDWPSGSQRVTATFSIEAHPKRGERGVRTTTGAPKTLTYARKARIVDGDDGRIYIAYSPCVPVGLLIDERLSPWRINRSLY